MSPLSFASLAYAAKKKRTRREAFLAEMDEVVPWSRLEAVIEPSCPKIADEIDSSFRPSRNSWAPSC